MNSSEYFRPSQMCGHLKAIHMYLEVRTILGLEQFEVRWSNDICLQFQFLSVLKYKKIVF